MRRLLILVALLTLVGALPAGAKMPGFDVEVEVQGDTIRVEVRILDQEAIGLGFNPVSLDGLLAVVPSDHVDELGRPLNPFGPRTKVPLQMIEAGVYQGGVTVGAGSWAVVAFPDNTDPIRGIVEGWYAETVEVEVDDETSPLWVLAVAGALVAFAWLYPGPRNSSAKKPLTT